jgi:hypothetical protein
MGRTLLGTNTTYDPEPRCRTYATCRRHVQETVWRWEAGLW